MASRRTVLIGGLALSLASAKPLNAWAHRVARTETEAKIAEDRSVTVTHVYHLHDAQTALFKAGRIEKPDLTGLKDRAILALYTEETFDILVDDKAVALILIGAEIIGNNVYVYQEGELPDGPLSIRAEMLRDLVRGQSNSVNIIQDGTTKTLDFTGEDGMKAVA